MTFPDFFPDPQEMSGYARAAAIARNEQLLAEAAHRLLRVLYDDPERLKQINDLLPDAKRVHPEVLAETVMYMGSRAEIAAQSAASCQRTADEADGNSDFPLA